MESREARRKTFDEVAELYDRVRPGYPQALVDDVIALSGLRPGGRILEIGCGPGKATVEFARRGYTVLALEPGAQLARVARRNLAAFPNVTIVECLFEDWSPERSAAAAFVPDLVMAAQSFHFVDPATGLLRVAQLLPPGGGLAIFGNRPHEGESTLYRRIHEIYARLAPELRPGESRAIERDIAATGWFEPPVTREHAWECTYSGAEYAELMETQSNHRLLPAERRVELLAAIREAIERDGGRIEVRYTAALAAARRRG